MDYQTGMWTRVLRVENIVFHAHIEDIASGVALEDEGGDGSVGDPYFGVADGELFDTEMIEPQDRTFEHGVDTERSHMGYAIGFGMDQHTSILSGYPVGQKEKRRGKGFGPSLLLEQLRMGLEVAERIVLEA